ncbi:YcbX family protein [Vibrio sp. MA40-2]|uniref:YcbX family protein n=1 Tax=Vibrio sp. MA40-2 TaxID=3391828 RepID=UPI0039A4F5AF
MSESVLSQISVYPIKSIKGIDLSTSWVEKQGIVFDRRLMLADQNGVMITARAYPQLVRVNAQLTPKGMKLTFDQNEPLTISYTQFSMQEVKTKVWNDSFVAYSTSDVANEWFSGILGIKVQLLYTGEESQRVREKLGHNVSFADGYPLLVISQGSLDELNRRSSEVHQMAQFRPNIVVSSTEPFIEDSWKRIKIGDVEFEIVKPCQRCILTTVDTNTGQMKANKQPLKTLMQFRADENGGVYFGQNLVALNEGRIQLDDPVEVVEYQKKPTYNDQNPGQTFATESPSSEESSYNETSAKRVTIRLNNQEFEGDNQSSILQQAEKQGLYIASSCRAGICGTCRITLKSGLVDQENTPVLTEDDITNGKILACCSVPLTDIDIIN